MPIVAVLRTWLGLVLISSGVAKLHYPHAAKQLLAARFGVPYRHTGWLIFVLSAAEVCIGGTLVAGTWPTMSSGLAFLLFAVSLFIVFRQDPDHDTGCGCFGILDAEGGNRRIVLIRNVVLALVAMVVLLWDRPIPELGWNGPALVVGTSLFLVSLFVHLLIVGGLARSRDESRVGSKP